MPFNINICDFNYEISLQCLHMAKQKQKKLLTLFFLQYFLVYLVNTVVVTQQHPTNFICKTVFFLLFPIYQVTQHHTFTFIFVYSSLFLFSILFQIGDEAKGIIRVRLFIPKLFSNKQYLVYIITLKRTGLLFLILIFINNGEDIRVFFLKYSWSFSG